MLKAVDAKKKVKKAIAQALIDEVRIGRMNMRTD